MITGRGATALPRSKRAPSHVSTALQCQNAHLDAAPNLWTPAGTGDRGCVGESERRKQASSGAQRRGARLELNEFDIVKQSFKSCERSKAKAAAPYSLDASS